MGTEKYKASVYLSDEELDLLEVTSRQYGVPKSQLIILAIKTIAIIPPKSNPITNKKIRLKEPDDIPDTQAIVELLFNSTEGAEIELEGVKEELIKINKENEEFRTQLRDLFYEIEFLKAEIGLPTSYYDEDSEFVSDSISTTTPAPGEPSPHNKFCEIYYRSIAIVAEEYGVNRPTLSKWINGKQVPQSPKYKAIFAEIQEKYLFVPGKGFKERD